MLCSPKTRHSITTTTRQPCPTTAAPSPQAAPSFSPWLSIAAGSCRSCRCPEHPPGNGFGCPNQTPFYHRRLRFPVICTVSGHCRPAMAIFPCVGTYSNRPFPNDNPCFHIEHSVHNCEPPDPAYFFIISSLMRCYFGK